ncbi:MAG: 3(2),5-bisphosphate nucleotidase CysQ [Caulobacteraceae bacterium]|nr:3(2),5-bisphosphate nucleotidase CysQ [Caulobacteraceae bacterium]
MTLQADLELIRGAALKAGELALQARKDGLKIWSKPGGSPVTDADIAVDTLLKLRLLADRPNYGWLSEETADDPARLEVTRLFLVDPIDGTAAYLKNRPWFTVCIAVVENGRPTCAVVHAPELNETYEATLGGGAFLNGRPIRPSGATSLDGAAMLGDARMFADPRWPEPWPAMRIESRNSIAYRIALVAAGTFDAALALSSKNDWDLAAADLIAREAGACIGDHLGRPFTYNRPSPKQCSLLCAAPGLDQLILQRLRHIDPPS